MVSIHLELVSDATTQAFIAALKRMVSRRGMVNHIISDNGPNLVGGNNYLKAIIEEMEQDADRIAESFQLKWTFMTPSAPHHGGIYEAAVKSTMYHLVGVIGETTLTFEEYATILCQVEACVNSRPICALNDDPTSPHALTPGHFIIGEALVRIPDEQDFREVATNRLDRWNHLQKMIQHFWDRWKDEYIGTLINRMDHTTTERADWGFSHHKRGQHASNQMEDGKSDKRYHRDGQLSENRNRKNSNKSIQTTHH